MERLPDRRQRRSRRAGSSDLLDKARGQTIHGDNLVLNLSAKAHREARALRESGLRGAVVALEPTTGASW